MAVYSSGATIIHPNLLVRRLHIDSRTARDFSEKLESRVKCVHQTQSAFPYRILISPTGDLGLEMLCHLLCIGKLDERNFLDCHLCDTTDSYDFRTSITGKEGHEARELVENKWVYLLFLLVSIDLTRGVRVIVKRGLTRCPSLCSDALTMLIHPHFSFHHVY